MRRRGPSISESTTLTVLARVGFAARGLVYLLCGLFAGAAAYSSLYQPHGIMDFVQAFSSTALRWSLAGSVAIGLACLATYFTIAAVRNFARAHKRRRLLFAAGMLGDAIVYAVVMLSIIGLLIGWPPDQQNETQIWTAWLMVRPGGRVIVGVVGLLILACGAGVVVWVLTADIDDDVALPEGEKRLLQPIGRYGLGGRGVAGALVGLYWMVAALHRDPSKRLNSVGPFSRPPQRARMDAVAALGNRVHGVRGLRLCRSLVSQTGAPDGWPIDGWADHTANPRSACAAKTIADRHRGDGSDPAKINPESRTDNRRRP